MATTAANTMKPIYLYDHLPGILAAYPAALFALLAFLSIPGAFVDSYQDRIDALRTGKAVLETDEKADEADDTDKADAESEEKSEVVVEKLDAETMEEKKAFWNWFSLNNHMLFWIGLSIMLVWYVAFRFNLPKKRFLMVFGLLGTFIGIPVVLELTGYIKPFSAIAKALGSLAPEANAGAFFVLSLVFFIIWLANFVWSRTHLRVCIDESGLTVNRLGGKGERFELIGLKTENEPLDYLELFLAGVGSLSLKTRMNKPIFEMKRVVGLYRMPLFPFFRGKLQRIEEMLSYQGKVVSVDVQEKADMAEAMDQEAADEEQAAGGGEEGGAGETESNDNKGIT